MNGPQSSTDQPENSGTSGVVCVDWLEDVYDLWDDLDAALRAATRP